ncbi:MAG: hypothetical protein IJJ15_00265 [Ruminococcus sp.]|nr:hypothetical protein [Ruminococcus sp.]
MKNTRCPLSRSNGQSKRKKRYHYTAFINKKQDDSSDCYRFFVGKSPPVQNEQADTAIGLKMLTDYID